MFFLLETLHCTKKVVLGRMCFFSDFLSGNFSSFLQNFVSKWGLRQKQLSYFLVHFGDQNPFLEVAALFSDFSRKNIDKIYQNPIRINRKSHKIRFKFD